jgi:hypothetical protein
VCARLLNGRTWQYSPETKESHMVSYGNEAARSSVSIVITQTLTWTRSCPASTPSVPTSDCKPVGYLILDTIPNLVVLVLRW